MSRRRDKSCPPALSIRMDEFRVDPDSLILGARQESRFCAARWAEVLLALQRKSPPGAPGEQRRRFPLLDPVPAEGELEEEPFLPVGTRFKHRARARYGGNAGSAVRGSRARACRPGRAEPDDGPRARPCRRSARRRGHGCVPARVARPTPSRSGSGVAPPIPTTCAVRRTRDSGTLGFCGRSRGKAGSYVG